MTVLVSDGSGIRPQVSVISPLYKILLCCNVTPAWLITCNSPSLFTIPRRSHFPTLALRLSRIVDPFLVLLPLCCFLYSSLFLSLSSVISMIDTMQQIHPTGNPRGNIQRDDCQDHINMHIDIQYFSREVHGTNAAQDLLDLY